MKRGFTMIEMLFVAGLMAILMSGVTSIISNMLILNQIQSFKTDINGIIALQERAKDMDGDYIYIDKYTSTESNQKVSTIEDYNILLSYPDTTITITEGVDSNCYVLNSAQQNLKLKIVFNSCTDSKLTLSKM